MDSVNSNPPSKEAVCLEEEELSARNSSLLKEVSLQKRRRGEITRKELGNWGLARPDAVVLIRPQRLDSSRNRPRHLDSNQHPRLVSNRHLHLVSRNKQEDSVSSHHGFIFRCGARSRSKVLFLTDPTRTPSFFAFEFFSWITYDQVDSDSKLKQPLRLEPPPPEGSLVQLPLPLQPKEGSLLEVSLVPS